MNQSSAAAIFDESGLTLEISEVARSEEFKQPCDVQNWS